MDPPLTVRDLARLPLTRVKGIGPAKEVALAAVGVGPQGVLDLLTYYPRAYVDRTNEAAIAALQPGVPTLVVGTVQAIRSVALGGTAGGGGRAGGRAGRPGGRGRSMVVAEVTDGSGRLGVTFFNQPWREKQLPVGTTVALFGRPEEFRGRLQMTSPVVDLVGDATGVVVPVYPQSDKSGLTTSELRHWVADALAKCERRGMLDPVPPEVVDRLRLLDRHEAMRRIHGPGSTADVAAARRRLVFDELLRVQLLLVLRKRAIERGAKGFVHRVDGELVRRFHAALPFPLTGAQQRVIAEILADLARPAPMHRLLQGDVGAGKTVVAVTALLAAVQGGHQGALMAPTEVLAEQHFAGVQHLLRDLSVPSEGTLLADRPLRVTLLTNRTTAAERRRLLAGLESGEVDVVVGTHALIEDRVRFRSLGVAVVDEQHRFGVEQRAKLRAKAVDGVQDAVPDLLVMTATPIPRTAAMTVYGDLDVSVLDELPPGRTPIVTRWARGPLEHAEVWANVRDEVAAGRQAYVVCPLVEMSDKLEVASAEETYEELAGGELHGLRLGLLHGRLSSREKDDVMQAFRRQEVDVLVATTVIEVGVDVPNATVMVILDADRFGIAQLHQLRGRVGRGAAASRCWLVTSPSADGEDDAHNPRLEALVATTDGFVLAEVDLDLRGEGTVMGAEQSGANDLRLASLKRDREMVPLARAVAEAIVDADPHLERHAALRDELEVLFDAAAVEFLFKS